MRILLGEDEFDAAAVLAKGLREHAYAVDTVSDCLNPLIRQLTLYRDLIDRTGDTP